MPPINPILDVFWTLRTLDAAVLDVAYFGCCVLGPFDGLPSVTCESGVGEAGRPSGTQPGRVRTGQY